MAERLAAAVEVSGLLRSVQAGGDFGAVLRRGDAERGSILLVIACRGRHVVCLQRQLDFMSGDYRWERVGPAAEASSAEIRDFLNQQARIDPDLWQIELDIASTERFIAETTGKG
ncbi:DUF1491 family protein [Sphingomonas piscis]|uniref:DUF1491 family protein n=1 Tax=Sphingomonas piscis TaxID=2714943 RepID=A0A6G7YPQ1_9SPHN|nr:DUF1491 family protein [Sphingomonas piscis]QIK78707.1 DUF1491 family protein [Sphingomonas piscis]